VCAHKKIFFGLGSEKYSGLHEKKGYHTNSNSYVDSTTSEALIV
jgi:hypothetical protein